MRTVVAHHEASETYVHLAIHPFFFFNSYHAFIVIGLLGLFRVVKKRYRVPLLLLLLNLDK